MLCKNFQPDTSQNDAAANFGACSEQQSKTVAKHSANDTTGEGNQTDKGRGGNDIDLHDGEADANSEGVYAGGDRLENENTQGKSAGRCHSFLDGAVRARRRQSFYRR